METAVQVMRYVHFSDHYTPQEYFEGKRIPSEKDVALYGQVFMAMVHRSWGALNALRKITRNSGMCSSDKLSKEEIEAYDSI